MLTETVDRHGVPLHKVASYNGFFAILDEIE